MYVQDVFDVLFGNWIAKAIWFILAFLLLVVARGALFIFWMLPALVALVVGGFIVLVIATGFGNHRYEPFSKSGVAAALMAGVLFFAWVVAIDYSYKDGLVEKNVQPTLTTQLPELLPRATAFEIAQKSLSGEVGNDSTTSTYDVDARFNADTQTFDWLTPKIPSNLLNPYFGQVEEVISIDDFGNTSETQVTYKYGEEMYFFDNVLWIAKWAKYTSFIMDGDVFYWLLPADEGKDQEMVIVAPLYTYKMHMLSFVPVWDGALIVYPSGETEYLNVQAAERDERFAGAQMVPPFLLEKQVENTCYRFGGLSNCWFGNKNAFDVPQFDHSKNQQPYLSVRVLTAADGTETYKPVWVITADPDGERNQSIVRLFIQDADSRNWEIVDTTQKGTLRGPHQTIQVIRTDIGAYTWRTDDGDGTHIVLEPRPAIQDDEFFWVGSITTLDYSKTAALVVVNADTMEMFTFCSASRMYDWFEGVGGTDSLSCDNVTSAPQHGTVESGDYENMNDSQLLREFGRIIQELENRGYFDK